MHQQHRRNIQALAFVIGGLVLLSALSSQGIAWGAPPLQGSIPTLTPPARFFIPVTGLSDCCLPGVVFTSLRDGNSELYAMKADGSEILRLTENTAIDERPAASFDGRRIAFSSNRDDPDYVNCGKAGKPNCGYNIYVMNVDGSDQRRLTFGSAHDSQPIWSASGLLIAFVSTLDDPDPKTCGQSGRPACVENIYLMTSDGGLITRLTSSVAGNPNVSNWDPNWSPDDTRIAFTTNRDGNDEIYTILTDGSSLQRLTSNTFADGHPAWSPDAQKIAFETNRDGRYQIYVMNADGTGAKRITDNVGESRSPIWLPGCTERIVYSSNRDNSVYRIYAMDPDGSNLVRLTTLPSGVTAPDTFPTWSGLPDSLRIKGACCVPGVAFDTTRDGNGEIYIMRYDGSKLTRLTFNAAQDMRPSPSSDGTRIAFESNRDGRYQIYVINVDGSGTTRITNSDADDRQVAWSFDNARMAFISNRDKVNSLYVMNADGSGVQRLSTLTTGEDSSPSWAPDSKRVIFTSSRDGNDEIYLLNADGTALTRLTNNPAGDAHGSISPDGKRIAFESNRNGRYQVFVMNIDGTGVKQITTEGENRRPSWCPSCDDRITFASNRDGGGFRVYVMSGDGSNQVRLSSIQPPIAATVPDDDPAWSGLPVQLPPALTAPASGTPTANKGG